MHKTDPRFPSHFVLPEPLLCFGNSAEATDIHPLRGLATHGPYSGTLFATYQPTIRCAAIFPAGKLPALSRLVRELWDSHLPRERKQYLPPYPGFEAVFGAKITGADDTCRVELDSGLGDMLAASDAPHRVLADVLSSALQRLAACREAFEIILIYLPDEWSVAFKGPDDEDFDLHDYIKAVAAEYRMPTQLLNEKRVFKYACRCSVMWRLSIALYCKAVGIPWKLAEPNPGTAYVGLSYALRKVDSDNGRFVTCCSQVFDEDGTGLEFLVYRPELAFRGRNPYLTREQMRTIMFRSKTLYQRRNAGRLPSRVVVHKSHEWRDCEIDGCFDAFGSDINIELIQIQKSVSWRGVLIDAPLNPEEQRGRPAKYPVHRGTAIQAGDYSCLLWTQGDCPEAANGRSFFKEGKGIPRPLMLTRWTGSGTTSQMCLDVLQLTKMNWNNDALYDRFPTTLELAHTLAQTAKRMPSLQSSPYPYHLFM